MQTYKPWYWANAKSLRFLRDGYLLENETIESRIHDIALAAEKILGIDGYAEKFERYMSLGYYSLSSPIWANFGRKRGLPISCVAGNSWINTRTDGGKLAKDIRVGDEVLTHKGRYRKVLSVIKTEDKDDIFVLKVASRQTPIKITGNHLVKTNLGWTRVDELKIEKHLIAVNGSVEIEPIQEFTIDLLPFSENGYEIEDNLLKKRLTPQNERKLNSKYSLNYSQPTARVVVDKELCWALGLWFADGSLTTHKKQPNGIRITLNTKEKDIAEKWQRIITEKFNINGNSHVGSVIRNNQYSEWLTCNANSKIIGNFFSSFGIGCKNKLAPSWLFSLDNECKKAFLEALLVGDGSFRKNSNEVKLTLANPKLILQIYRLGLELGLAMSLQMQDKPSNIGKTCHVHTIVFRNYASVYNKSSRRSGIRFEDGLIYAPITKLERTKEVLDVYDFTVEEDHSFSVSGVVVHNCNGSLIPDTMDGILYKTAEVGMMSKHGAGTSAAFSDLRPRGASISAGGVSSGPVHFMELFDTVADVVAQSGVRRGSFAAYLPIEHPDIKEFLLIRGTGHPIQRMSIGVTVTDDWMRAMIGGDKAKRQLWAEVIKKRFDTGYPYIVFIDNANNNAPQIYKDKNLKVKASNLCVAPETLLLTKNGNKIIKDLAGCKVEVWNGDSWSLADVIKTGENQKLYKVILNNGQSLDCTDYHKWYISLDNWVYSSDPSKSKDSDIIEKRTHELKPGDKVFVHQVNYTNNIHYDVLAEIQEIIDTGRVDDTYCVNEPISHKAVFNGILTGNCTEIFLPASEAESFVCDLSSINLLHYHEWKNTDAVKVLTYFLDAVMTEYIEKLNGVPFMEAARNFAKNHRALGVGVIGWHSFLQSQMIPFEGMQAKLLNAEIFKYLQTQTQQASAEMAELYGEPLLLKGYGLRNTTTMAIAPTTSSAFILGQVSPSIEPYNSNYFVDDKAKGKYTFKNPYLAELLKKYDKNDEDTWRDILLHGGSVQHLSFLSQEEKNVFKTFGEISQLEIVIQAAQRQKFIDQGQSLNLTIHPKTPAKEVNLLMIKAWELGLKSLYYQRGTNLSQELGRNILACTSCQG